MKKSLLTVALFAGVVISTAANAYDGTVNFTGTITDEACTVDTNSINQTVDMGKISKTSLKGAGTTAGAKQFTLVLKDCPDTTTATVRFDGTQVPGNDAVLALKEEDGKAQNVGIQLSDNNNKVINLYQDSTAYAITENVENKLTFNARYYALSDDVVSGTANAVTNFTIAYQ